MPLGRGWNRCYGAVPRGGGTKTAKKVTAERPQLARARKDRSNRELRKSIHRPSRRFPRVRQIQYSLNNRSSVEADRTRISAKKCRGQSLDAFGHNISQFGVSLGYSSGHGFGGGKRRGVDVEQFRDAFAVVEREQVVVGIHRRRERNERDRVLVDERRVDVGLVDRAELVLGLQQQGTRRFRARRYVLVLHERRREATVRVRRRRQLRQMFGNTCGERIVGCCKRFYASAQNELGAHSKLPLILASNHK